MAFRADMLFKLTRTIFQKGMRIVEIYMFYETVLKYINR
jgi:hypothetical protein